MRFANHGAEVFVPDGSGIAAALARTTHVAVGGHADDVPIMAFSAVAECYDDPDHWLLAVTVTDGRRSPRSGRFDGLADEELRLVRRNEERRAAAVGRYSAAVVLDYPSDAVVPAPATTVVDDLMSLFTASRPAVVFTHSLADRHSTHIATALAVIESIRRMTPDTRPSRVYGGEVWGDLDWLTPEDRMAFEVGPQTELARELLGVYESQIAGGKRYDAASLGRRAAHATFGDPRSIDRTTGVDYAMDLTPMTRDTTIDPIVWLADLVDRARDDAVERLRNVTHD